MASYLLNFSLSVIDINIIHYLVRTRGHPSPWLSFSAIEVKRVCLLHNIDLSRVCALADIVDTKVSDQSCAYTFV